MASLVCASDGMAHGPYKPSHPFTVAHTCLEQKRNPVSKIGSLSQKHLYRSAHPTATTDTGIRGAVTTRQRACRDCAAGRWLDAREQSSVCLHFNHCLTKRGFVQLILEASNMYIRAREKFGRDSRTYEVRLSHCKGEVCIFLKTKVFRRNSSLDFLWSQL